MLDLSGQPDNLSVQLSRSVRLAVQHSEPRADSERYREGADEQSDE